MGIRTHRENRDFGADRGGAGATLGEMSDYRVSSRLQRHDLHKLHGLGNDFLVWFRPALPDDASMRAQRWCARRTGIGADGLIVAIDDRKRPQFVLFNADGGRAEVSGNGLRCFGHAVVARRGLDSADLAVATDAGVRMVSVTDAMMPVATASVSMGPAAPGPVLDGLDLSAIVDATAVSTIDVGNPHVIIEVDHVSDLDIEQIGPAVEAQFLPIGANVHLAEPTETGARLLIWERGVGATQACGSGAAATAAVMARSRPGQTSFSIEMPGGTASVHVGAELVLTGSSTYVGAIDLGESNA